LRVALLLVPAAAIQALLPIVVRGRLDLGSGAYGALLGCFGFGAAASAVARPRIEERLSADAMVASSSVILAVALVVQGYVEVAAVVGAALFLAGFAWTIALTTLNVAAQATLAGWVRARGMGLFMLVLTGSVAGGSVVWGALAGWSVGGAHAVAAAALIPCALASRRRMLGAIARIDVTPVPGIDPVVTLTPAPKDGPVLITIAYRLQAADMAEFVIAMRRAERHRRRTGAYRWGLFRDLADPERFLETFVVDSWAEHVRQHHRSIASIDAHLKELYVYLDGGVGAGHYVSAYSPGALAPHEPLDPADPLGSAEP
jgi:Transmembrane secretion effector